MGKYMRKAKVTGEVSVMELVQSTSSSSSFLGVRTRAKTLALQRLQNTTTMASSTATTNSGGTSYLQLRSRRLEKPCIKTNSECKKQQQTKENPNPRTRSRLIVSSSSIDSVTRSCCSEKKEEEGEVMVVVAKEEVDVEDEAASFGENVLEIEQRERSARETTPCSQIRDSETVETPGSTTRPTISAATNRRMPSARQRNIPTTNEMDEFFAGAERQQQRLLTEKYAHSPYNWGLSPACPPKKYNFDPVSDSPLPGRYEWVRTDP